MPDTLSKHVPSYKQYLITFYNTTHTMETYNYAKKHLPVAIMPVLRLISKSCGLAIEYQGENPSVFQAYFDTLTIPSRLFFIETPVAGERCATLLAEHTL